MSNTRQWSTAAFYTQESGSKGRAASELRLSARELIKSLPGMAKTAKDSWPKSNKEGFEVRISKTNKTTLVFCTSEDDMATTKPLGKQLAQVHRYLTQEIRTLKNRFQFIAIQSGTPKKTRVLICQRTSDGVQDAIRNAQNASLRREKAKEVAEVTSRTLALESAGSEEELLEAANVAIGG